MTPQILDSDDEDVDMLMDGKSNMSIKKYFRYNFGFIDFKTDNCLKLDHSLKKFTTTSVKLPEIFDLLNSDNEHPSKKFTNTSLKFLNSASSELDQSAECISNKLSESIFDLTFDGSNFDQTNKFSYKLLEPGFFEPYIPKSKFPFDKLPNPKDLGSTTHVSDPKDLGSNIHQPDPKDLESNIHQPDLDENTKIDKIPDPKDL